jgi:hypothetical protein
MDYNHLNLTNLNSQVAELHYSPENISEQPILLTVKDKSA